MRADSLGTVAQVTISGLLGKGKTLAVAESCTGGLIGKTLTDISGSSAVFYGGFILYSNEAKQNLAGVSRETLEKYGAVSAETVQEMAEGTRARCRTDYALSVSGIAGPGGATPGKPVGTVWVGLARPEGTDAFLFHFSGDRDNVRSETVREALSLLNRIL